MKKLFNISIGTKSILFGFHQFLIHPFFVYIAWIKLYKKIPNFEQTLAIIVHDWGYWGKKELKTGEGESHPEFGARIMEKVFKKDRYVRGHSRYWAKVKQIEESKLCWPDKMSNYLYPFWLQFFLYWITGEFNHYMFESHRKGEIDKGNYSKTFEDRKKFVIEVRNFYKKVIEEYRANYKIKT